MGLALTLEGGGKDTDIIKNVPQLCITLSLSQEKAPPVIFQGEKLLSKAKRTQTITWTKSSKMHTVFSTT